MAKVALIVSSNNRRGQGHLARCLNIRKKLNKNVVWFIDSDDNNLIPKNDIVVKIKKISLKKILDFLSSYYISLVVIDSYDISNKIKTKISKKVKVIAIEDTLTQIGGCKVIFPHPITVHKNNNIHTGIKYAAVDTKKKKNRKVFLYKKKIKYFNKYGLL